MLIDFDTTKKIHTNGYYRVHVPVTCSVCGEERWYTTSNAKQLKSDVCVSCRASDFNKSRALYTNCERRNGTAYREIQCPRCDGVRIARARMEDTALCGSCASILRQKVGIIDEDGKTCSGCLLYLPYSKFNKMASMVHGYASICKECLKKWNDKRGRPRAYAGLSRKEWKKLKNRYGNKCLCCGRSDLRLEADHIIPVSRGGTNDRDNIQPLCHPCNVKKSAQTIDYRRQEMNGLLKSRKFYLALFGILQVVVLHFLDVPEEIWQAIATLVGILIAAIAVEDAGAKIGG